MKPSAVARDIRRPASALSGSVDTGHLGLTLRRVYEGSVDTQPITDAQIELLLRLRQKERELRRAS
ncbi:hypothetical protein Q8W71_16625 [Methylobacterium sp. NEAU 140]|uniref:hypothetical protein n=1 Tax=Methylobacterium sp. NEAU 140 TaxID=3064945 RepID=UPI002735FAD6|nr:hypothetical protein [Methylobacterium sp. NEAU 140]MDP4024256.1 hypothetical protein [Methylobacterium sp. NEAU 140]